MRMTVEEAKKRFPNHPGPIPLEYAGQWIDWNRDQTQILAHGHDFSKVHAEAKDVTGEEPIMHFVIPYPFLGGPRQQTYTPPAADDRES